jgi:PST family polysaccharide transporter
MVTPVVAFIMLFQDLGLSMASVQRKELSEQLVSQLFWVNVLSGLSLTVVTAAGARLVSLFYGDARLTSITMALGTAFLLNGLVAQQRALLIREMRLVFIAFGQVSGLAAGTAAGIVCAAVGLSYWSLVIMTLVQTIVTGAVLWARPQFKPSPRVGIRGVRDSLSFGLNYTGYTILYFVSRNVDNVLLGRFWGSNELGLYNRAYSLLLLPFQQLNGPFQNVVVPALSRLQDDNDRYAKYYLKALSMLSSLALPAVVALVVLSRDLVRVLLGEQWMPAARIFAVLGITALFHTSYLTMTWLNVSLGRPKRQLHWWMIATPVTLAGILAGLAFGGFGVAIGYTAANAVLFLPGLWYGTRGSAVSPKAVLKASFRPFLVAAAVGIIVYLVSIAPFTKDVYARLVGELGVALVSWAALSLAISRQDSPLWRIVGAQLTGRRSKSPNPRS